MNGREWWIIGGKYFSVYKAPQCVQVFSINSILLKLEQAEYHSMQSFVSSICNNEEKKNKPKGITRGENFSCSSFIRELRGRRNFLWLGIRALSCRPLLLREMFLDSKRTSELLPHGIPHITFPSSVWGHPVRFFSIEKRRELARGEMIDWQSEWFATKSHPESREDGSSLEPRGGQRWGIYTESLTWPAADSCDAAVGIQNENHWSKFIPTYAIHLSRELFKGWVSFLGVYYIVSDL